MLDDTMYSNSEMEVNRTVAASVQIKTVKAWHEELIDFMLVQPRAGLKETAEIFGVSMSWLSIVKNSDAFRDEWERRREQHSSAVSVSLVERVEALAEVAVDTMTRKLEREGEAVGLTTLREISETALKSLGFGARESAAARGGNVNVTNNTMVVVDRETLARAREARSRMQIEASKVPSLATDSDSSPEQRLESDRDHAPKLGRAEELLSDGSSALKNLIILDNIPPRKPLDREGDFMRAFGGDRSDESDIDSQDGED